MNERRVRSPTSSPPHLLHVFSTFVPAGPELRTVQVIHSLGDEFRHSILAMDGRSSAFELLESRPGVSLIPSFPKSGTPTTLRRLSKLFRKLRPDAVLSYNWGAFDAVLARIGRGSPRVLHHEEGFNLDEARRFKLRRLWARRLALPHVHKVVVPSLTLRELALSRWKLDPEKVRFVPNGVELERFAANRGGESSDSIRARLDLPEQTLTVGYVGHLRPEKNPLRLLAAARSVLEATPLALLFVGDGPERQALESYARREGIEARVRMVGHQSDPVPYYRAMDLFAISSDTEQMPVALLEAMAAGLPVVSTDVGDVRAILPAAQQHFVRDSQAGLAEAIVELGRAPEERERLGRLNRRRVEERFGFTSMVEAYRGLYWSVVGG